MKKLNCKLCHTPAPWQLNPQYSHIEDAQGNSLALLGQEYGNRHLEQDEIKANAEHIVKCVNAHDELVEVVRAVEAILKQNRALGLCQGSEYVFLVKKCEQALKKAGEL